MTGFASAQVYEFSKPNVPVNDDSLGRHHHFNTSQGQHIVAFKGDTMYAVWTDYRRAGSPKDPDIYFARSTDGGNTFLPNIRVNDDPDTIASQAEPSLSLGAPGEIHVVWDDNRLGEGRIFYAKSTDGGRTFSANQCVNDTSSAWPMVASDRRGTVCVGWWQWGGTSYNIWLSRSSNSGQTFGRRVIVNDSLAHGNASLALDSMGRAFVAWVRNRDVPDYDEVFLSRSTDPGDTLFLPSVQVSYCPWRVWDAGGPSVVVGREGRVCVALLDKRYTGESGHVYVARSTDWGDTFLANVDVSDNNGQSGMGLPSIALDDSGNAYAAWEDSRNGYRCIYFARSRDSSCTVFSPNILVNDTAGLSGTDRYGASLSVNERGEAFVTWSDDRVSGSIYLYDIFSSHGVRKVGVEGEREVSHFVTPFYCKPNPFISFTCVSGHASDRFTLYDISGRRVGTYKGDRIGADVPQGVYFLKAEGKDGKPVRVVKVR